MPIVPTRKTLVPPQLGLRFDLALDRVPGEWRHLQELVSDPLRALARATGEAASLWFFRSGQEERPALSLWFCRQQQPVADSPALVDHLGELGFVPLGVAPLHPCALPTLLAEGSDLFQLWLWDDDITVAMCLVPEEGDAIICGMDLEEACPEDFLPRARHALAVDPLGGYLRP